MKILKSFDVKKLFSVYAWSILALSSLLFGFYPEDWEDSSGVTSGAIFWVVSFLIFIIEVIIFSLPRYFKTDDK